MFKTSTAILAIVLFATTVHAQPMFTGYVEFPLGHAAVSVNEATVQSINIAVNKTLRYQLMPEHRTPEAIERSGYGDCKDYTALKRARLLATGVPDEAMKTIVGFLKGQGHEWLAVMINGQWRVLDNNFDLMITPDEYVNFVPVYAVGADGVTRFGKTTCLACKGGK